MAANWATALESSAGEAVEQTPFIGPLPAGASRATRQLIQPVGRSNPLLDVLATGPSSEQAAATSDAALVEDFGPQIEQTSLQRQRLAWSSMVSRRHRSSQEDDRLPAYSLGVDMLLSDPRV